MKAIRVHKFGGPEVLQLDEVADPKPGEGQALVRVHAIGVNPVETYVRAGAYAQLPTLPYIPGGGTAGERMTGAYAELAVCNVGQAKPLAPSISFAQGAAVNVPYATAYRGLFHKARVIAGETVLVHGASGGVGVAAVQLANAAGLTVIGTAGTERGRKLVREQGAHHVLDHTTPDYLSALARLTDGRGPNVIIENLANVNLQKDLDVVARYGRIVVIGNRGTLEFNARGAMSKDAVIYGLALWNATPEEMTSIHAGLVAGLANGTLRPVVGRELPLKDAAVAHAAVMEPGAYGKIVLIA
jgi:NADPH2:quinone reductase